MFIFGALLAYITFLDAALAQNYAILAAVNFNTFILIIIIFYLVDIHEKKTHETKNTAMAPKARRA